MTVLILILPALVFLVSLKGYPLLKVVHDSFFHVSLIKPGTGFAGLDNFKTIMADERFKQTAKADAIPIGYRQDVKKGTAYIRSDVSGIVKDYEIEIQKVDYTTAHKNKGMVIKVTDPELLAITGGIVQGMSGSPIIQDGKLIGAVTHVFIQDSTRGYGIFIENMLEAAE